jgi:hypothetical protein
MGRDQFAGANVVGVERIAELLQFATQHAAIRGGFDPQGHAVSGNPVDSDRNATVNDNAFADLASEYKHGVNSFLRDYIWLFTDQGLVVRRPTQPSVRRQIAALGGKIRLLRSKTGDVSPN